MQLSQRPLSGMPKSAQIVLKWRKVAAQEVACTNA